MFNHSLLRREPNGPKLIYPGGEPQIARQVTFGKIVGNTGLKIQRQ